MILNLHCPPYASGLDDAPGLNEDLTPKHGGHAPEPVGSKAVRTAIEETRPALSLHGHIHEARGHTRIGDTLCINPGSAYEQGELLGAADRAVRKEGQEVRADVRLGKEGLWQVQTCQWNARCSCARPRAW